MILPFKKTYIYAGFGSVSGILKLDDEVLEIEYQTIDEIFRYFKSDAKQISLHLSDIESVEFKKGWFSYKLLIDVKRLKSIEGFPAVNANRLSLRVSKSEVEKLKNLKSNLLLAISEKKLSELELDSDSIDTDNLEETTELNENRNLSGTGETEKLPNALRQQKEDG